MKNSAYYKIDYIRGRLYDKLKADYLGGNDKVSEKENSAWDEEWNRVVKRAVSNYKDTSDYERTSRKIAHIKAAYLENGRNIDAARVSEIDTQIEFE